MEPLANERPGERVPGSRWVRAFCVGCGTPIRVMTYVKNFPYLCEKCRPLQTTHLPRPPAPDHDGEEASPWQENAIRLMEDQE
jgi:hypothetical protein